MTDLQQTYLQLLRQAIGLDTLNAKHSTLNDTDWQHLMHLAQIQGTGPLIYNEILKNSFPLNVKATEQMELVMKSMCLQNMLRQQRLMEIVRQSFGALERGGITPILLKGFGLATLYSKPYLRAWGDLDVYVGPNQYHQACALLRKKFPKAKHPPMEYEEFKHYNFDFSDGYNIETHRVSMVFGSPSENRIWQQLEREGCLLYAESITIDGFNVMIPEAKFNMLFVFAHAWEHFVDSGMPIKQLCDLALLAHQNYVKMRNNGNYNIYQNYLHTNLTQLHLLHQWKVVGYIIVNYLYLPEYEWPEYDKSRPIQRYAKRFFQRVIQEGGMRVVRPLRKDFCNPLCRKIYSFHCRINDSLIIFPVAPSYALRMVYNAFMKGLRRLWNGPQIEWGVMVEN